MAGRVWIRSPMLDRRTRRVFMGVGLVGERQPESGVGRFQAEIFAKSKMKQEIVVVY